MHTTTRLFAAGIILLSSAFAKAQSSCYQNPSLEGPSQAHVVPGPWQACYGSPDTQPGQWGITLPPSNGNSYVSFLHAGNSPNGYSEGMTQLLVPCMVAGQTYSFTVDLAHSNIYNTASPGNCYSSLAVWGGATACARTQLLWTSGVISNTTWQQYTITFTPTSNWCYISFEPYYISACSGYINVLMDNISCIVPVSSGINGQNVTCNGACNGMAWVTPTGGPPPYTFSWAPTVSTNDTITNLCPGTYTCVVTASNGQTTTNTITITQPPAITATQAQTNILCNGLCTGTANVTASGGTGTLTYNWTPGNPTGDGTPSVSGLCAGTWTCTITDANGCTATRTFNITQPPALTATSAQTNILCNGQCTGSATVTPSGGNGAYSYNWTPGNPVGDGTPSVSALCAGTWTCTITDANGCSTTQTFSITQPPALALTSAQTNVTCNGACDGTASVTASGGTPPYTYNWAPTGGTGPGATNLCAGTYTCTVTDANGCVITQSFNITQASSVTASGAQTDILCNGLCTGSATVTASGGTGTLTYSWSPSGGTTNTASSLCPGPYTCTITDANGCTTSVNATITEPTALVITSTAQTDVTCFGIANGTASVVVSGGTVNYSYAWAPSGGNGATASNLGPATYTCTITDANNCSITQTFTITEPPQLTVAIAGFNATCNGACDGQVVVIPAGGTQPYGFAWNPNSTCNQPSCSNVCAGTYTVIVTDANGCTATDFTTVTEPPAITATTSTTTSHCNQPDGTATVNAAGGTGTLSYSWATVPVQTTATATALIPGSYVVTITDANGCTMTATAVVPNAPGVTLAPAASTNVSCFGVCDGVASVTAASGTLPYVYSWNTVPAQTTANATALCAGTYICTVTDSAGCTATATMTITEPAVLTVTPSAGTTICNGLQSQISATAGGGTQPYNYVWNPGALAGANQNVSPAATTTYTVTVTDANGCTVTGSTTVTVNPVPVAALSSDVQTGCSPLAVQFSDLSTVASPGTITSWSWDFGDGTGSTQNPAHTYNTPGVYTVILTVTTSDGCTHTITMPNYITVVPDPVAEFAATPQPTTILEPNICFLDQSIGASTWSWSFGDIANSASSLMNPCFVYQDTGCYDVLLAVTSPNGCVDTVVHPICIAPDYTMFIPNTFTPDGNGSNDVFIPVSYGVDLSTFEMWIFDRWGNMIYYTDNLSKGWDGKVQGHDGIAQIDTYVYKIRCKDYFQVKHLYIGHVNLVK